MRTSRIPIVLLVLPVVLFLACGGGQSSLSTAGDLLEIPCPAGDTLKDCLANFEHYGAYYHEEEASVADHCAGWAMDQIATCGLGCYLDCQDFGGVCNDDGQFESWVWDATDAACTQLAYQLQNGDP